MENQDDLFQQPDPRAEQLYEMSRIFGDNWGEHFAQQERIRREMRDPFWRERWWDDPNA